MAERGEVYWADLNPPEGEEAGREQSGRRPVLILQNSKLNRILNTVIIVPITSSPGAGRLPTSVHIPPGTARLSEGYILCPQVRVLDIRKLDQRIGQLPSSVVDRAFSVLVQMLDRPDPAFLSP